ncbi:hypothetical protein ACFWNL_18305 [Kitasatospora sp. NPDC058397]|uniref:hypothetical protein n=1 Tax=unclassified Kitasatospora TaxID=2633591 RepID=UPI0036685D38
MSTVKPLVPAPAPVVLVSVSTSERGAEPAAVGGAVDDPPGMVVPAPAAPVPLAKNSGAEPAAAGGTVVTVVAVAPSPSPVTGGGLVGAIVGREEAIAPQHETEVTVDDCCWELADITERAFKRHEGTNRLTQRAEKLARSLEEFKVELVDVHNIVGRRTNAAVDRMIERVQVMAQSITEIGVQSLAAAELSEVAEGAMFDEYKPIQRSTADAGLSTPSAAIHNES